MSSLAPTSPLAEFELAFNEERQLTLAGHVLATASCAADLPGEPHVDALTDDETDAVLAELVRWVNALKAGEAAPADPRPLDLAPRDGTLLRLLVDYSHEANAAEIAKLSSEGFFWPHTAFEDTDGQAWTVGFNSLDHTGQDEWEFVGWNWSQDCFTEGHGKVVGWLPFHDPGDAGPHDAARLAAALKALVLAAEKTPRVHAPADLFLALSEAKDVLLTAPKSESHAQPGTFDAWLTTFEEDVVQTEHGYEPGEFTVYPDHWRQAWEDGLTPSAAFRRACEASTEARKADDALQAANALRIKAEDRAAVAEAKLAQEGAGEPTKGWLYHCPDTGTEWSDNHPIESGEVPDAKDVRPATLDALHAELMAAWEVLAERPSPPNPQEGAGENTVGAAEAEVGRYVYRRIEALMGATDGTAEGRELSYLSAVAASVEEYGEEACAGTDLAAEHFGQEGAVEPVAWTGVTHVLKTWPEPFEAVADGLKPWELRRNDRGFKVGDRLVLHKFNPETAEYLGAKVTRLVTWMLEGPAFGLPEGYVIMSLSPPNPQARIEALAGEARAAAAQFRFYAESHAAKGTPDGDAKARTNIEWAERLERAALNQGADHGG